MKLGGKLQDAAAGLGTGAALFEVDHLLAPGVTFALPAGALPNLSQLVGLKDLVQQFGSEAGLAEPSGETGSVGFAGDQHAHSN